jgi:uncharacterized protein (TIGR02453 family)
MREEALEHEGEDESQSDSVDSFPPESDDDDEDEYTSEEEQPRKQKMAKGGNGTAQIISTRGKELWRPGVKADLAPGEEIYIQLPKARQPGKTPYTDDTIHPNTFLFLGDLAENNDRQWLKMHDADFRQSEKDFDAFIGSLTEKVIEHDGTIPELPPKDLKFRIYRDVRFSTDQTPYKTHFSAAWSRTGRKGPYAAYYVQVKPGGSFVGGGLWAPDATPLAQLRRDVDRKSHKLKAVLMNEQIRKHFFNGIGKNEKKAVEVFISHNSESMLKTKPKVG